MDNYILKSKKQLYKQPIYVELLGYEVTSAIPGYLYFTLTDEIKYACKFSREKALEAIDIIGSAHGGYALIDLDDNYVVKVGKYTYVCYFRDCIYSECDVSLAKRMSRKDAFLLKNNIIGWAKKNDYLIPKVSVFHLFKSNRNSKQSKSK